VSGVMPEPVDPKLRQVTRIPLKVVWDENGIDLDVQRDRDVGAEDIRAFLRSGRPFPFVVATRELKWIRGDERFDFWRNELQRTSLNLVGGAMTAIGPTDTGTGRPSGAEMVTTAPSACCANSTTDFASGSQRRLSQRRPCFARSRQRRTQHDRP
jgi:hypothetical protein